LGLPKYNYKYRIANVNDIRHIISGQTNSVSQFESGLRNLDKKEIEEMKKLKISKSPPKDKISNNFSRKS
jgi:hypothetical protein